MKTQKALNTQNILNTMKPKMEAPQFKIKDMPQGY